MADNCNAYHKQVWMPNVIIWLPNSDLLCHKYDCQMQAHHINVIFCCGFSSDQGVRTEKKTNKISLEGRGNEHDDADRSDKSTDDRCSIIAISPFFSICQGAKNGFEIRNCGECSTELTLSYSQWTKQHFHTLGQ